jgi:hypothetical protein
MSSTRVGNWFNNWHPVTIPLLLLVLKIGLSLKLGPSYRFVQHPLTWLITVLSFTFGR